VLVHLLRHGEPEGGARHWGGTDVALSPNGWQQMRAAVGGRSWDLIVSSPLRRCAAFAEALARELPARCQYEPDLREMSFGQWEGRSAAELMQTDPESLRAFWSDPSVHTPPGGEPLAQLRSRVMAAWQRLVTDSHRVRLLIVTHSGPIRLLLAAQSRTPLSSLLSIDVPYAALIEIKYLPDRSFVPDPNAPGAPHSSESL
jgi:alpha-ribazole phosphatase